MADLDAPHAARLAAILEVARRQLSEVGPGALSLRSIAREAGVVPSALYRYVEGRDGILTALIVAAYDGLGDAVDAAADTGAPRERWLAAWRAARMWAVGHPHEHALLYGTPVIGYAAPATTVGPAIRVVARLARIAIDAGAAPAERALSPDAASDIATVREAMTQMDLPAASPALVTALLDAWTHLVGAISFELFGHYRGSLEHGAATIERLAADWADRVGLPG